MACTVPRIPLHASSETHRDTFLQPPSTQSTTNEDLPPNAIPVPMHYSSTLRTLSTRSGKSMRHRRHGDVADESANAHREVMFGGDLNESVVNRWLRLARTRTLAVAFRLAADVTVSRLVAVLSTAIVLAQVRVTTVVPRWNRRRRCAAVFLLSNFPNC